MLLHKSYIWEKSCSWVIGQNAFSQSDCRISKWIISPEQIDETGLFLACWYGQSGLWTLKLTVSQEWTNGINWYFACWYYFMQIKLKVLRVGMVNNGCGQSCDRTLKLIVSEEWAGRINCFFTCWCRFTQIKSWTKIYWVGMVKNRCGQTGWFLIQWFNDSMIFGWVWSKMTVVF